MYELGGVGLVGFFFLMPDNWAMVGHNVKGIGNCKNKPAEYFFVYTYLAGSCVISAISAISVTELDIVIFIFPLTDLCWSLNLQFYIQTHPTDR